MAGRKTSKAGRRTPKRITQTQERHDDRFPAWNPSRGLAGQAADDFLERIDPH
jgi:hypothetical protein